MQITNRRPRDSSRLSDHSEKIFANDPRSENDSVLEVISTADGRTLREFPLEAEPVFDGMAAAYGRLYMAMKDGKILCMAADTE